MSAADESLNPVHQVIAEFLWRTYAGGSEGTTVSDFHDEATALLDTIREGHLVTPKDTVADLVDFVSREEAGKLIGACNTDIVSGTIGLSWRDDNGEAFHRDERGSITLFAGDGDGTATIHWHPLYEQEGVADLLAAAPELAETVVVLHDIVLALLGPGLNAEQSRAKYLDQLGDARE